MLKRKTERTRNVPETSELPKLPQSAVALPFPAAPLKKRACHAKAGRNLYECILKFGYTIIQQQQPKMKMMQLNILIPF